MKDTVELTVQGAFRSELPTLILIMETNNRNVRLHNK